jgi:2-polyprenyl-6-methoxyphenol hydroxylase-like FAD-dependent oxidoreductase
MGASMAMEDASVLVEELRSKKSIDEALIHFAQRREKRIRSFRRMVNFLDGWTMAGGLLGRLRNRILPWIPESYFVRGMYKFVNARV